MDIKSVYPYSQYFKDDKIDLQKVIAEENMIADHIKVGLLLCVIREQQKRIDELSITAIEATLNGIKLPSAHQTVSPKPKATPAKSAKKPGRKKTNG
jgi:uncharacterized radical SAM superfamily protein